MPTNGASDQIGELQAAMAVLLRRKDEIKIAAVERAARFAEAGECLRKIAVFVLATALHNNVRKAFVAIRT